MTRAKNESGTAIVEFIWLALILLVPLLYVVLATFETQRAAYAASAAARSASRAFVGAPDQATGYSMARAAVDLAFADQGVTPVRLEVRIRCEPRPRQCLTPGSVVTVEVRSAAPLPLLPGPFGAGAPAISIGAEHRSPYGTFREGRP